MSKVQGLKQEFLGGSASGLIPSWDMPTEVPPFQEMRSL